MLGLGVGLGLGLGLGVGLGFCSVLCAAEWRMAAVQSPCAGLHGEKEASSGRPERPSLTATARGCGGAPSAHRHRGHSVCAISSSSRAACELGAA